MVQLVALLLLSPPVDFAGLANEELGTEIGTAVGVVALAQSR